MLEFSVIKKKNCFSPIFCNEEIYGSPSIFKNKSRISETDDYIKRICIYLFCSLITKLIKVHDYE